MAFETLDADTGTLISAFDFRYEPDGPKLSKEGLIIFDSANDQIFKAKLTAEAQQLKASKKGKLLCPECKSKDIIFMPPRFTSAGIKRYNYFAFKHSVDSCPLKSETFHATISSHPPEGHNQIDELDVSARSRLVQFFRDIWFILFGEQITIPEFNQYVRAWEKKNRLPQRREVLIRNKDILLPFLALYREAVEKCEKNKKVSPEKLQRAKNLLSEMPLTPEINKEHLLVQPFSFLRNLGGKFPYLKSKTSDRKNLKMEEELKFLIANPEDFFMKRPGSKYSPATITAFNDLPRIFEQQNKISKLISDFVAIREKGKERKEYSLLGKTLISTINHGEDDIHIKACFDLVMFCEAKGVDCAATLSLFFNFVTANGYDESKLEDAEHCSTETGTKINKDIRFELFYRRHNDTDLFLSDDFMQQAA